MLRLFKKRSVLLVVCIVLVLCIGTGGTLAYIVAKTGSLNNLFAPSYVDCLVTRNENDGTYTVQNTGNIDAYIRVAVVVTWQDSEGKIFGQAPQYTVNGDAGWKEIGGYRYWESPVNSNGSTGNLTVTVQDTAPSAQYYPKIQILAQAIQAKGTDGNGVAAVTDAWGVPVGSDGKIGGVS